MSSLIRSIRLLIVFLLIMVFAGSGCVSTKRQILARKKQQALCDLTRLGKNKYYYSDFYHRKLNKTERKIEHR